MIPLFLLTALFTDIDASRTPAPDAVAETNHAAACYVQRLHVPAGKFGQPARKVYCANDAEANAPARDDSRGDPETGKQ